MKFVNYMILKVVPDMDELEFNFDGVKIFTDRPELVYGATAIVSNKIFDKIAINPFTKEYMPFINLNENEDRFFIPAHNQEDFRLASNLKLPIKQVVAPYFKNYLKLGVKTETRNSVIAIVKHPDSEKFLCLDAKNKNCRSFVMGGIERNEKPDETAIREIKEETGYQNIKINFVSKFKLVNHFYVKQKDVNRLSFLSVVIAELLDLYSIPISNDESAKHNILWIDKKDLLNFLNINANLFALDVLKYGDQAFIKKDGIILTNDKFNLKSSDYVRKKLLKEVKIDCKLFESRDIN